MQLPFLASILLFCVPHPPIAEAFAYLSISRHQYSTISNGLLMDNKRRRKEPKTSKSDLEEVSSIEWEFINMTEQEEDLIYRMYRLVGDRWALIAGRIPGRKPEEIERFWIMRHGEGFAERRKIAQANDS